MTRFQKLIVALLSVLVVLVAVGVILVVNVVTGQQRQAAYEACLKQHGYTRPHAPVSDTYMNGLAEAAEDCGK